MKTKTCFFWIAIIFILSIKIIYPQSSIWFESPTDGQIITNTTSNSESEISVYLNFDAKTDNNPRPVFMKISIWDQNNTLWFSRVWGPYQGISCGASYTKDVSQGTYNLKAQFSLSYSTNNSNTVYNVVSETYITIHVKNSISVINNIGAGSINIDNATKISGAQVYKYAGDLLSAGAIDQSYNGYDYTWNTDSTSPSNWKRQTMHGNKGNISGATNPNLSYTVASNDNGATISSDMRKKYYVTFQNYYNGIGNAGAINVNGTVYNSPSSNNIVIDPNQISVQPVFYSNNGIDYYFTNWTGSNGNVVSTNSPWACYPSDNATYTANYIGKPNLVVINMGFDLTVGGPIKIHWTDNPNTNVTQYQIWRKVPGGSGEMLIGTIGRGVQTFTDRAERYTGNYNDQLIYYDVRQYYSTEGTYSNPYYRSLYGEELIKLASQGNSNKAKMEAETIDSYNLAQNSPNPFNPSTTIEYQLPNDGFVSLKVYDILGREVKTLVNEIKSQGKYSVRFDAANLTSGVYIYQLKANGFSSIKKMILTK